MKTTAVICMMMAMASAADGDDGTCVMPKCYFYKDTACKDVKADADLSADEKKMKDTIDKLYSGLSDAENDYKLLNTCKVDEKIWKKVTCKEATMTT